MIQKYTVNDNRHTTDIQSLNMTHSLIEYPKNLSLLVFYSPLRFYNSSTVCIWNSVLSWPCYYLIENKKLYKNCFVNFMIFFCFFFQVWFVNKCANDALSTFTVPSVQHFTDSLNLPDCRNHNGALLCGSLPSQLQTGKMFSSIIYKIRLIGWN